MIQSRNLEGLAVYSKGKLVNDSQSMSDLWKQPDTEGAPELGR